MDEQNRYDLWEQSNLFEETDPDFFKIDTFSQDRMTHGFFTGHRRIPDAQKPALLVRMKSTISYLYALGVRTFHAGGAMGFDMLAAAQIFDLRRSHTGMRLVLDLPFYNQTDRFDQDSKRFYAFFLEKADEVHYAYEGEVTDRENARKYLLMRNRSMVAAAHYGIAYYSGANGGTAYTLAFAQKHGCEILNLYE